MPISANTRIGQAQEFGDAACLSGAHFFLAQFLLCGGINANTPRVLTWTSFSKDCETDSSAAPGLGHI